MADRHRAEHTAAQRPPAGFAADQGSAVLAGVVAGAVLGAAGLAWWLLSLAERRRLAARQRRTLQLSRLQGGADPHDDPLRVRQPLSTGREGSAEEKDLHDKVHELNEAIEAVRRQLEQLQPQG